MNPPVITEPVVEPDTVDPVIVLPTPEIPSEPIISPDIEDPVYILPPQPVVNSDTDEPCVNND